ncbi:uncharacterized protein F4822DRAFT_276256 [Hypoxylon trugodes]|uniref:uncharacterized protein n=1 Tax=Hypoxylon trugodes TaxID=326681 RepID=UPI0021992B30|nr:uncharacterized protein F4822DRAFT_276256 [Hypoxylon trugodes]KAI1387192.1 hypothetical protein F4822DRAFT_276256 [Hypoxylon trugodes]
MHRELRVKLVMKWDSRVRSIPFSYFKRLQLCFEECYCAMGCCRLVDEVLELFEEFMYVDPERYESAPGMIEVTGWNNEQEKDEIHSSLMCLEGERSIDIRFIGKSKKEIRMECRAAGRHP